MTSRIPTKQKKLAQYLLKSEDTSWDDYLKRFEGTRPLEFWRSDLYTRRFIIVRAKWEGEVKNIDNVMSSSFETLRVEKDYKISAGFIGKVKEKEILSLPYLYAEDIHLPFNLYRRDIVELMQAICPEDFQAIPITLRNLRDDNEYFEIKDFYILNIYNCVDAVDQEKSLIDWNENFYANVRKLYYKEDPWQEGCFMQIRPKSKEERVRSFRLEKPCKIAHNAIGGGIIWHPELAGALPTDSYHWFHTDEDWRKLSG